MDIQWLKFGILLIAAILNLIIGLLVYKKDGTRNKSQIYFVLVCLSASMWIISSSIIQITKNPIYFLWADKFIYFFTTLIIFFFWAFVDEFPYRLKKFSNIRNFLIIIITILILSITLSNFLIIGNYTLNGILYQKENKNLNFLYGIYFILLFVYSSHIIIKKYLTSVGVNKNRLGLIIFGTIPSFIIGTIFAWYLPYIGKHYLYWIGTLFTVPMNLSIAYLLFKRY